MTKLTITYTILKQYYTYIYIYIHQLAIARIDMQWLDLQCYGWMTWKLHAACACVSPSNWSCSTIEARQPNRTNEIALLNSIRFGPSYRVNIVPHNTLSLTNHQTTGTINERKIMWCDWNLFNTFNEPVLYFTHYLEK